MRQELQPSVLVLGLLDVADVRWSLVDAVQRLSWEHLWRRTWQLCRHGWFEDPEGHEKGSKRRLGLVEKA